MPCGATTANSRSDLRPTVACSPLQVPAFLTRSACRAIRRLAATGALADKLEAVEATQAIARARHNLHQFAGVKSSFRVARRRRSLNPGARHIRSTLHLTAECSGVSYRLEIELTNAPVKYVYVDSINGEIIAAV